MTKEKAKPKPRAKQKSKPKKKAEPKKAEPKPVAGRVDVYHHYPQPAPPTVAPPTPPAPKEEITAGGVVAEVVGFGALIGLTILIGRAIAGR